jgi:MoaA/NifB/PqqE/SkfB family radical SAM enzyme
VGCGSRDAFDEGRELADKAFYSACYAPTASMYFDQFGKVRACCQNSGTRLGDVTTQTLREIWESVDADRLRSALAVRDFSEGCGFCKWQADEHTYRTMYSRNFDHLRVASRAPEWPMQMEFSLTNACNLQCVMCNGDLSSAIRANRERRAPLPAVYGDRFFDELADFLPHLTQANFLGGEPFLGREPLRVLDMLADGGSTAAISVTTNGTLFNERIRRTCERLRVSFVVSLDGITRPTYEAIRVGADLDRVLSNVEELRALAAARGGAVSLAHCLMTTNWHEFLDLLTYAEEREMSVGVNTVFNPSRFSLYKLPRNELAPVVDALARQDADAHRRLTRLLPVWTGQLDALGHRLGTLEDGADSYVDPSAPWHRANRGRDLSAREEVDEMSEWAHGHDILALEWDGDGNVTRLSPGWRLLLGPHDEDQFVGSSPDRVVERLAARFGPEVRGSYVDGDGDVAISEFLDADGTVQLRTRLVVGRIGGAPGALIGYRSDIDGSRRETDPGQER